MVCRRFSAWSKTMLAGEPNTSPVISRPEVIPVSRSRSEVAGREISPELLEGFLFT